MFTPSSEFEDTAAAKPSLFKKIWQHKLGKIAIIAAGLALIAIIALGITAIFKPTLIGTGIAFTKESFKSASKFLEGVHPFWIFLILAIIPSTPFPVSVLLVASGIALHSSGMPNWQIATLVGSAMLCNMIWTYLVAAGPARNLVDWILRKSHITVPSLSGSNEVGLALVLRLTPGIPYFLHALVLGFMRISFIRYLIISLLTTLPLTIAFALLGNAFAEGKIAKAFMFLGIIVFLVFTSRLLHQTISKRQQAKSQKNKKANQQAVEAEIIEAKVSSEPTNGLNPMLDIDQSNDIIDAEIEQKGE